MLKVHCPLPGHLDRTPSCDVRYDPPYCFTCSKQVPWDLLKGVKKPDYDPSYEVEDLEASLRVIKALPKERIRGFSFPSDGKGYYIVWPDDSYYKRRNWEGPKYYGPKGHSEPLFWAKQGASNKALWIVEGQINAMSAALVLHCDVVSPGGVAGFNKVPQLAGIDRYQTIVVVSDRDRAGNRAGIELCGTLRARHPYVSWVTMSKDEGDCNDIYVKNGAEGLKEALKQKMRTAL